ncbi:hypothetical protein [Arthrobacter sp. EPSL27]|uniref:hypothetical protein n=1 Tax=Arthrobacter sp. EPSL27 TaxID=1745378 RepID=UPI0007481E35|nr:hypothetical protein [Arthrobacter sp. EPSL27]KUM37538.1 hypothetical protein AR539_09835 [Arthrobacter sp. EPSL27]
MTRPDPASPDPDSPDPDSPDPRANQDDAVWLDLVARLEGKVPDTGSGTPAVRDGGSGPGLPAAAGPDAKAPAAPRPFSDFDPLGLSGGAPVELSAKERQAQALAGGGAGAGAPDGAAGGDDRPGVSGPRDSEAGDDDDLHLPGDFVPEEPPSLAGADPMTVLAWLGAVGGPVALLMSAMFWRSAPLMAILGMVAAFAASVVFLIMKLPGEKDEYDDGARL